MCWYVNKTQETWRRREPLCGWRSLTLSPCLAKFKPSCRGAWSQPSSHWSLHASANSCWKARQARLGSSCAMTLMSQPRRSEHFAVFGILKLKIPAISFTIFIKKQWFLSLVSTFGNYIEVKTPHTHTHTHRERETHTHTTSPSHRRWHASCRNKR